MVIINREKLAWAGGFYSGEGSTFVHRNTQGHGRLYVRMAVNNTSKQALFRFYRSINSIGKMWSHNPYAAHHKHVYVWRASNFEEAQAVLAMLWKFLSKEKRAQARKVFTEVLIDMQRPTQIRNSKGRYIKVEDCNGF